MTRYVDRGSELASTEGRNPDLACEPASTEGRTPDDHCITCGDDGVPMRVLRIDEVRELALCEEEEGARSTVEIALVAPVAPGDTLLVHAGTALVRLEVSAA